MPDTPPPSDTDEIEYDMQSDDDVLFEIIDYDEVSDAIMMQQSEPPVDDSIVTFSGHSGAVFCCNLDKTGNFASSGGHDDKAFVWNTATGDKIFECTDHKESVIATAFNHDSSLLATGDMEGLVQVWNVKDCSNVWSFTASQIMWMDWLHNSNVLIAGTEDGECWLWSIDDDQTRMLAGFGSGASCGSVMPDGKRCVVGYEDGVIRFWNLEQTSVLGSLTGPVAHKNIVTTVDSHSDNTLALTGSADGTAKLIKSTNSEVIWDIKCADPDSDISVESAVFFPGQPLLATGTNSGILSIWDIPTKILRSSCDFEFSIVKMICDPTSPLIYTAATDGYIKLFDGRSGNEERKWGGHTSGILDFVLSRDLDKILSSSEDGTCKVFKISQS